MKIVHALGWYFPESVGGTEVYVAGLCRCLQAAGCHAVVVAPLAGGNPESTYVHEGVTVYRYAVPPEPTRDESQNRVPARGAERLHAWLQRESPDLVHFHTFTTGLGLAEVLAAKGAGARVVATNHLGSLGYVCQRGTLMRWGKSPCEGISRPLACAACELEHRGLPRSLAWMVGGMGWPLGGTLRRVPGKLGSALGMPDLIRHNRSLQEKLLESLDRFVLLNRRALEVAAANGAPRAKLVVNYLGVSHARRRRKAGPDERPTGTPITVGYLGRLVAIKGVLDLARAFASLASDLPLRLELRGPSTEPKILRSLRQMVGDDPRVRIEPAVPPSETLEILAGYDLLVVPSVWFENGPTVMSEAHAVGTPVVGTRVGAMPEIIIDGVSGRLVEPGDWRALASVLREIARDPKGTVDRWRRALPRARTMDEITADYLALYETVGAGPR
jgi:glycosyltransferase involved in cell wall biosynthesis